MESKGHKYNNHYATIIKWIEEDKNKQSTVSTNQQAKKNDYEKREYSESDFYHMERKKLGLEQKEGDRIQTEFYKTYIKSPEWRAKESKRMEIDNFKCVMCGRSIFQTRSMQVHHVNYKNLGHEDIYKDLCTLCGRCHKWLHNYLNRLQEGAKT